MLGSMVVVMEVNHDCDRGWVWDAGALTIHS